MPVDDDETIFRAVEDGEGRITIAEGQSIKVSSSAFFDRNEQPSVDLAKLCGEQGPRWTQLVETNGVLRLKVGPVRATKLTGMQPTPEPRQPNQPKQIPIEYKLDVVPCPVKDVSGERDNPAHAEIRPDVPYVGEKPFRRLKERLAKLARVEIYPASLRDGGPYVEEPETE